MEYRVAKNIRGRSLSSLITERITEGSGVGSAIGRSVTQKLKATGTGILEKFDPLNLIKFATGGSRLAPAVLGRMTGRSQSSIQYFAGDRQPTPTRSYTPISKAIPKSDFGGSSLNVLNEILSFLRESYERDTQRRETEKSFIEEKEFEQQRRHKEFIEVLKTYTSLPSYAAPVAGKPEEKKDPTGGILDTVKKMIAAAVEGIKGLLTGMLSMIGKMIQSAIDKALAIFGWVKNLEWMKKITSIGGLLELLKKTYPILRWLLRFAGPAALAYGIIQLIRAQPDWSEYINPERAASLLSGSPMALQRELKSLFVDDPNAPGGKRNMTREDLVEMATRPQRAKMLMEKIDSGNYDENDLEQMRKMGGLEQVKKYAEMPQMEIPSYEESLQLLPERAPRTKADRPGAKGLLTWRELYEPFYTDEGLRRDLVDFVGPLRSLSGKGISPEDRQSIEGQTTSPYETMGQPPPSSLSTPINESDLIQTPYQFTPLPVNSQVNALSKVLDEMQLDRSGPSNAPIVSTNTRNIPLPRKPISSTATTRDNTPIFQRTIERNRARY